MARARGRADGRRGWRATHRRHRVRRIVDTIRSLEVPHLHEVGLRDRFVPEGENTIKTTLGMIPVSRWTSVRSPTARKTSGRRWNGIGARSS